MVCSFQCDSSLRPRKRSIDDVLGGEEPDLKNPIAQLEMLRKY
jgi:hypothetical protein